MKVVLVSPGWPAEAFANGIASYIGNLRRGLENDGVQSWVLAQSVGRGDVDCRVVDLSGLGEPPRISRSLRRLYQRVFSSSDCTTWTDEVRNRQASAIIAGYARVRQSVKPDLIEMDDSFGAASLVAAKVDVPVVVRLHGPYFLTAVAMGAPRDAAYRHRLENERQAILGAQGLTSPSADLLEGVRGEYGEALPHARVIPNPAPDVAATNVWGSAEVDPNLVLFVGRFDRHKGGDLAIQAFVRLARERPSLRLAFVGPDRNYSTDDGRPLGLQEFLAETTQDESILSRFEFHGQLPAAEIAPLRRKAALTLVASRWENFPMTVLEALAHGSPLVAPATGGIAEIVTHEQNGLLFEPENVEAMASNVARLLDAPELAASCGSQGLETIRTRFSVDVVARQTREYYENLLQSLS